MRLVSTALGAIGALAAPLTMMAACQGEFRDTYGPTTADNAVTAPTVAAAPAAQPSAVVLATRGATSPPAALASAPTGADAAAPAPTAAVAAGPTTGSISGTVTVRPAVLSYNGRNVVVWLDNPPSQPAPDDRGTAVELDQRGMAFVNILTVVRAGGKIHFLNADPFPHNIFTPDHEKFDLGTMPHGDNVARQFDHPGHYTLLCNLHPNMLAYVEVTPSGWFTQPDKDGKFSMPAVPNGTYTVKAWGGRMGEKSESIVVNGADVAVDFHLQQAD